MLSDYMQVLKNLGYGSQFRREVLKSGTKGYRSILADHMSGLKPIYRSREWQKSSRRLAEKSKKKTWMGS